MMRGQPPNIFFLEPPLSRTHDLSILCLWKYYYSLVLLLIILTVYVAGEVVAKLFLVVFAGDDN